MKMREIINAKLKGASRDLSQNTQTHTVVASYFQITPLSMKQRHLNRFIKNNNNNCAKINKKGVPLLRQGKVFC